MTSRKDHLWLLLLTALPWSWFALRDRLGVLGDLLAILLPVLVIALAGIGVLAATRRVRWLAPVVSVLVMGVLATVGPWLPADAGPVRAGAGVSVLGANVMGRSSVTPVLVAAAPDVLVISELSRRADAPLATAYPYRRLAWESGAVGVYSRLPLRPAEPVDPEVPGVRVQVDGPAGEFVLYALHVPRPWYRTGPDYQATPGEQHRMVAALTARIAAERLPVVVVGDLNLSDRGRGYRLLLDGGPLVDAIRDGATGHSSVGKWTPLLLRIDHVLVSPGWCGDAAGQLELAGSDHRGVAATVGPCAGHVGSPT